MIDAVYIPNNRRRKGHAMSDIWETMGCSFAIVNGKLKRERGREREKKNNFIFVLKVN